MLKILPYIEHALFLAKASSPQRSGLTGSDQFIFWAFAVMMGAAYAFVVAGLFIHLSQNYNISVALSFCGIFILVSGFLLIGINTAIKSYRRRRIERAVSSAGDNIGDVLKGMSNQVEDSLKDHPEMAVAAAAIAGFLIARRII